MRIRPCEKTFFITVILLASVQRNHQTLLLSNWKQKMQTHFYVSLQLEIKLSAIVGAPATCRVNALTH